MAAQEATGEIQQRRPTLWSLTSDEQMLEAIVSDAETDEDARAMAQQFLDDTRADLNTKLDGYAEVIGILQARAKARKERADELAELARVDANRAKGMLASLKAWWQERGLDKPIQTARHRISLVKNGGVQPLEIVEEEFIPERYFDWVVSGDDFETLSAIQKEITKTDPQMASLLLGVIRRMCHPGGPNNGQIREALLAGDEVPGARLGERGESLRIK